MEGINTVFVALIQLLQFVYDWTLGLLVRAASVDPGSLGLIRLILWIIVLVFVVGVALWLIYILFNTLFLYVRSIRGPLFYRHPYFYFPLLAWICAFVLLYIKFTDIPL
jgi:hypothetical protein